MACADTIADRLWRAGQSMQPCQPLDDLLDASDTKTAYHVQDILDQCSVKAGRSHVGWKVGLTSDAAMKAFGTPEPMVGHLYGDMLLHSGASINVDACIQPLIEGELVFRVSHVPPALADDEALMSSLMSVHAGFEIAESRIQGWPNTIAPAIADNACCGHFVIGEGVSPTDISDFAATEMEMRAGETLISSGTGSACLGNPLNVYRWLLGMAAATHRTIAPGDYILTGAMGPAQPMQAGKQYTVSLGGVGAAFVET